MKKLIFNGFDASEANVNFSLFRNATTMWKKAGSPMIAEELNAFLADYLKKTTKNSPGVGCYIVLDPAVQDTRENPYKITNIPTEGKRKFKRVYELVNSETGAIIGQADSKDEAMTLAKSIVSEKREELGIGVKHVCRIANVVVEGQPEAFTFEYTPSLNAKPGKFLLFGIEADTI